MSENAKPVAHANWKDADEFCRGAFGPFGVDTEPYTKIVAELMQHAADRALASRAPAQCAPEPDGVSMAIEACAKVADRFLESDLSYAIKYPDEAQTFVNRSQRAKTIAYAIRALIKAKEGCA